MGYFSNNGKLQLRVGFGPGYILIGVSLIKGRFWTEIRFSLGSMFFGIVSN